MIHDWVYNGQVIKSIEDIKKIEPKVWGFVYILNLYDSFGRLKYHYIGKKNIYSVTNKPATQKELATVPKSQLKKKKIKGGWKYYRTIVKESNWKVYTSSNNFIKKNGSKFEIKREIICFSTNDSDLTYKEAKEIICQGALENNIFLNDGVSIRRFAGKLIN